VLREVEATLGPLLPLVDGPGPQEVAPPANGVVATPCRQAAELLGPLVAPGSHFLELLVVFDVLSFDSLWLPNAVRRVIYAPGASSGEVALVEQSMPDLLWPVDILLGASSGEVGDHLVFHFKLGTLEASVRIFAAADVRRTYPQPAAV
jgi:hypothetical protein